MMPLSRSWSAFANNGRYFAVILPRKRKSTMGNTANRTKEIGWGSPSPAVVGKLGRFAGDAPLGGSDPIEMMEAVAVAVVEARVG